jgi:hypothetical protein
LKIPEVFSWAWETNNNPIKEMDSKALKKDVLTITYLFYLPITFSMI